MIAIVKKKTNGRFYVEITTNSKQIFKTMSFKKEDSANEYALNFKDAFGDKTV